MTDKKNELEYKRVQAVEKDCWEDDVTWTIEDFLQQIKKKNLYSEEARVVKFTPPEIRCRFKIKYCSKTYDKKIYYNLSTAATLSYEVFLNSLNEHENKIAEAKKHSIPANKWLFLATLYNSTVSKAGQRNNLYNTTNIFIVFKYKVSFHDTSVYCLDELSKNFEQLFREELFSDATMKCADGLEFKVHRNILASRSPVLRAQFAHGTTETYSNKVESPFEGDVLHDVLLFIYSNKSVRINEIPDKLLEAADYYQLDGLKSLCAHKLYEILTVENAVEILQLADRYHVDTLKDLTLLFLKDKASWLLKKSETWDQIESVSLLRYTCRWLMENDEADTGENNQSKM